MNRDLSIKSQKIPSNPTGDSTSVCFPFSFEPAEDHLKSTRGALFGIIELRVSEAFDLSLASKIAVDVLEGSYYGFVDGPPLPAMERSVLKAKDKLFSLAREKSLDLEFNIIVAASWGRVLYLAKLGKGGFYLFRSGAVKEIIPGVKQDIALASGMIEEGDVVIAVSPEFHEKFSKEILISKLDNLEEFVETLPQPNLISVLVLKFDLRPVFNKADILSFSLPKIDKRKLKLNKLTGIFTLFSLVGEKLSLGKDESIYVPREKRAQRGSRGLGKLVAVLGLALVASVIFTISRQRAESVRKATEQAKEISEQNIISAKQLIDLNNSKARDLLGSARDELLAAQKLDPQDSEIGPKLSEIDGLMDKVNRVRFVSEVILETQEEIFGLSVEEGKLRTLNREDTLRGVSLNDEDTSQVGSALYFDNVYFLVPDRNQIVKYIPLEDGSYSRLDWVKKEVDLADAVSLTIDGDIYVLKANGEVFKFTQGEREDFSIVNIDEPFVNPISIYTDPRLDFVYILDSGRERVLVISKDGFYNSQYKLEGDSGEWSDLRSVVADPDSAVIYISTSKKVWKAPLE